jgi:hypothetical protein
LARCLCVLSERVLQGMALRLLKLPEDDRRLGLQQAVRSADSAPAILEAAAAAARGKAVRSGAVLGTYGVPQLCGAVPTANPQELFRDSIVVRLINALSCIMDVRGLSRGPGIDATQAQQRHVQPRSTAGRGAPADTAADAAAGQRAWRDAAYLWLHQLRELCGPIILDAGAAPVHTVKGNHKAAVAFAIMRAGPDTLSRLLRLALQLRQLATAACALLPPPSLCCANPACSNASGLSEMHLVWRRGLCGHCNGAARFCSEACLRAHWPLHSDPAGRAAAAAAVVCSSSWAAGQHQAGLLAGRCGWHQWWHLCGLGAARLRAMQLPSRVA